MYRLECKGPSDKDWYTINERYSRDEVKNLMHNWQHSEVLQDHVFRIAITNQWGR